MSEQFNNKVINATKWAALTEVVAKLVSPITSMILARVLTPDAFGVVATLTMVITFAEVFTDAGFQKYLIQHEFVDKRDQFESTTVAFWSNITLSIVLWGIIALFSDRIAYVVGNPGKGLVLAIACISIPIEAFSSIQMGLYKRNLDFKTLFKVRIVGIFIPIFVTVPCALIFRNYWALVFGTIVRDIVNAFILTFNSSWKPNFFFSFRKLREMLSFTVWSLVEGLLIWLSSYVDIFFIGIYLSEYYLGLFKTSISTVGQITGIITSLTVPLFPALSRVQNDNAQFELILLRFQKILSVVLVPVSFGIFCYSDLITRILLGEQWMEASNFIGLWSLINAFAILLAQLNGDIYRAMGKPKLSSLEQIIYLFCLIIAVYFSVNYGFKALYISRSLIRLSGILIGFFFLKVFIKISPLKIVANVFPAFVASTVMLICSKMLLHIFSSYPMQFLSMVISALIYFIVIMLFPKEKAILKYDVIPKFKRICHIQ